MKNVAAVLLLLCLAVAPASAASYFFQFDEGFGGRGYVTSCATTSDGRQGLILNVNGTLFTLPCADNAQRWDSNLNQASGAACDAILVDGCANQASTTGFSTFTANRTTCTAGVGACVSVAGSMAVESYLSESPFLRPVVDRVYERASGCN
jgi:hypothetical protein